MPFIGIIAKESDSNFIKNEVSKNSDKNKFEFINISKKSIENIKNIRFETLIINDGLVEFIKTSKYLEKIIEMSKYIIVNSDMIKNPENLIGNQEKIITYGLNREATITISSINNDNILICIQKKFADINRNVIEEQEVSVKMLKNNRKKVCNSMGIFAILTIYGDFLEKI